MFESSELIKRYSSLSNDNPNYTNTQTILNKKLIISRSAITALNLIKLDEEKEYIKKATSDKQSDILRLILLFLNEEFYEIPQNQLPEYFIEKILKKFKVESFSNYSFNSLFFILNFKFLEKLLMEYIPNNIMNIDFDLKTIVEFVSIRPFVFNSGEFISNNRLLSYCTFLIKDIFDYLNLKLFDGTYAYCVRRAPVLIDKYESKLAKKFK